MKGIGGFVLGLLTGVACGILILQVKRSIDEDAESLSERLGDYVGELEDRISALEDDAARSASL